MRNTLSKAIEPDWQFIDYLFSTKITQTTLLEKWCRENGWSNLRLNRNLEFYAIPANGKEVLPLPEEALVMVEKYQQVFYILDEARPVQKIYKIAMRSVLLGSLYYVCMLYASNLWGNTIEPIGVFSIVQVLIDVSVALCQLLLIMYTLGGLWSFCAYWLLYSKLAKPHYNKLLSTLKALLLS